MIMILKMNGHTGVKIKELSRANQKSLLSSPTHLSPSFLVPSSPPASHPETFKNDSKDETTVTRLFLYKKGPREVEGELRVGIRGEAMEGERWSHQLFDERIQMATDCSGTLGMWGSR